MAEEESIEARARAIERMKATRGKEFEAYQAAENQLINTQAQLKQNLASARERVSSAAQQNNLIEQVAGLVGGGMAAIPVNSATQGVLGKYGLGPTISKTMRSSNRSVAGGNVVINNYNTTTTNTTTPVVQGGGNGETGKFKVWVQNLLARQNEQNAIRDKEYDRKERALTRSSNRMTRKLESISSEISSRLDSRNIGAENRDQLMSLLRYIGIPIMVASFPKIVKAITGTENKIRELLKFVGVGTDKNEDSGLVKKIKYFLGGDENSGKSVSLFDTLKSFLIGDNKHDGLYMVMKKEIELFLDDRRKAIENVKKPEGWEKLTLTGFADYLTRVLSAVFSGTTAQFSAAKSNFKRSAEDAKEGNSVYNERVNSSSGYISQGDLALIKSSKMSESHLSEKGELVSDASSIIQSKSVASNLTGANESGTIDVGKVTEGLKRLEDRVYALGTTERVSNIVDGKVVTTGGEEIGTPVDKSFLDALEKIGVDVSEIGKTTKKYKYVVIDKSDLDKLREDESNSSLYHFASLLGSGIGGVGGGLVGGATGNPIAFGAGVYSGGRIGEKLGFDLARYLSTEGKVIKLVPEESNIGTPLDKSLLAELRDKGLIDAKEQAALLRNPNTSFAYQLITKSDMQNIKKQLTKLAAPENKNGIMFGSEEVESTIALGNALKDLQPTNTSELSEEFKELNDKYNDIAEYKQRQKDIIKDSYIGISANRLEKSAKGVSFDFGDWVDRIKLDKNKRFFNLEYGIKESPNNIDSGWSVISDEDSGKEWDIEKAISKLRRDGSKNPKPTGKCAKYVGRAILEGFGHKTGGSAGITDSAKDYGKFLRAKGFERIPLDRTSLVPGDIIIWQPRSKDQHGHIAMYDGERWISDWVQKDIYGGNHRERESAALYRHPSVMRLLSSNSIVDEKGTANAMVDNKSEVLSSFEQDKDTKITANPIYTTPSDSPTISVSPGSFLPTFGKPTAYESAIHKAKNMVDYNKPLGGNELKDTNELLASTYNVTMLIAQTLGATSDLIAQGNQNTVNAIVQTSQASTSNKGRASSLLT